MSGNPRRARAHYRAVALPANVPTAFSLLLPDDEGPASPDEVLRLARVRLRLHAWASAPQVRDPPPSPVAGEFEA